VRKNPRDPSSLTGKNAKKRVSETPFRREPKPVLVNDFI
jgi:hypothetical protein